MMTKKHYVKIAKILSENILNPQERYLLADDFSQMFQEDNPRFARDQFMSACKRTTDDKWVNLENPFKHYR